MMEVETSSCVDAIGQHAMASLLNLHRGVLLSAYEQMRYLQTGCKRHADYRVDG